MMGNGWHSIKVKEVFQRLETGKDGLDEEDVLQRQKQYGFNELKEKKKKTALNVLMNQFKSVMILILLIASLVSVLLGEYLDAGFILFIIIINSILGFIQEYRAEKALEALKKLTTLHAEVIRNGKKQDIEAKNLVPGDIIFLDEGRKVPADARIIQCSNLKVDESMLTGESTASEKDTKLLKKETSLADQKNMLFMGTLVTTGNSLAVVTKTGMNTKMGEITDMVQRAEEKPTLLQRKLDHLSKVLAGFVIIISLITFILGIYSGSDVAEMFFVTVSLAVSAVPEGLPTVITVTLALGVQRMARKNAIIRKLPAAESLGSANIICTDKTGTLTKNEMTAREYYFADGETITLTGTGYSPEGDFLKDGMKIEESKNITLLQALKIGVLCNNAELQQDDGNWTLMGDHTEGSLLVSARKANIDRQSLEKENKFFREFSFTSERKRMTKIFVHNKNYTSYSKGAPEMLIEKCSHYLYNGKKLKLTVQGKKDILEKADEMASRALRLLLLAYKEVDKAVTEKEAETGLTFVSLVGMIDPPREEVAVAVMKAKKAGIRTVMITGDHAITARAIAKEIGLVSGDIHVITGTDLDRIDDSSLRKIVEEVSVYARVSPEHKVRILKSLMENENNFVAMTGDGVNDAPAVKNADIGVSMGLRGTDVTKESSDIILLDDNYATIINAIEEGRGIYDNITKFVRFLLSSNFDELFLVGIAAILQLPLPLLALQILWLNIVTDGLPALALGMDSFEKDIMERKPRKPKEGIIKNMLFYSILGGIMAFLLSFFVFFTELPQGIERARTMTFTISVVFELMFVYSARTLTKSAIHGLLSNKYLIFAVISSILLHLVALYIPVMNTILQTVPLGIQDWSKIIMLSIAGIIVVDLIKVAFYKWIKHENN